MEKTISTNDEIFELLLRDAFTEKAKRDAKAAKEQAIEHKFSPQFEKAVKKIERHIGMGAALKAVGRTALKIAAVWAVVMGIAFAALLTQPSISAAVQNVFREKFETYDKISFEGKSGADSFDREKRPQYLPAGYEIYQINFENDLIALLYKNSETDMYINIQYGIAENYAINLDTEYHFYETVTRGDVTYYYYDAVKTDPQNDDTLVWYSDGLFYMINAQLSFDELVKVAENIK